MEESRSRYTDERLDDKFETVQSELIAMKRIPETVGRLVERVDNVRQDTQEAHDALRAFTHEVREEFKALRDEMREDRRSMRVAIVATLGPIAAAAVAGVIRILTNGSL